MRTRSGRRLTAFLMILVAIGAAVIIPLVLRHQKQKRYTTLIANARELGLALFDFDADYGFFPSPDTYQTITTSASRSFSKEDADRNPLIQLQYAGIVSNLDELLAVPQGAEGNWLYFPGLSTTGSGSRIVVITPKIEGRRLALGIDNSAAILTESQIDERIANANPPPISIPPTGYR